MKSLFLLIFSVMLSSGAEVTLDPLPGGKWTVKDEQGKVCMKMSLSAGLEVFNEDKPSLEYNIDQSFAASGLCAKPFRQFTLTSPDPSRTIIKELQLTFFFDHSRDSYTMTQIMANWFDTTHTEYWEKDIKQGDNLLNETVEHSKSYKCNRDLQFFLQGGYGSVFLWNIELVPFVEDYHYQAQECSGVTKTDQQCGCSTGYIVGSIFGGVGIIIVVVLITAAVGYYCRRESIAQYIIRKCGYQDEHRGLLKYDNKRKSYGVALQNDDDNIPSHQDQPIQQNL